MKTKPFKFENEQQFIDMWRNFCNSIVENGFDTVPTQTAFCKWLKDNFEETDRKTIYNYLNKIFPTIKKEFEQLQSDIIMQGGMLGKYNPTMSIFGLKNWCGWGDNGNNAYNRGENPEDSKIDRLIEAIKEVK